MTATDNFMKSPLVVWVETFNNCDPIHYDHISDGIFLNEVMVQIDPQLKVDGLNTNVDDIKERLTNWDLLLRNIRLYYQDVLQQFIVMKLPNIMTICKQPHTDSCLHELHRVLLLILGCAVQCEQKELFIDNIKTLKIDVQHEIVDYIKDITDESKNVFAIEVAEDHLDEVSRSMYHHLKVLIEERDGYVEEIRDMSQNLEDMYHAQQQLEAERAAASLAPTAASPEKHHMAVELAECKSKLRKIRQELEEKTEQTVELQEELEENQEQLSKFRSENLELMQDARAVRTYRDEMDILKEKASRVDKIECEVIKYKEKMNELDFYKQRVEEIREENALIVETKNVLEDQIAGYREKLDTYSDYENDFIQYKQHLESMTAERDSERHRVQELLEDITRLEFEKRSSFNESATLEEELSRTKAQLNSGPTNSLSDQLSETTNTKVLRLELENQRLQKMLANNHEHTVLENTSRVMALEKENSRLSNKVKSLQESTGKEARSLIHLEKVSEKLQEEKSALTETLETEKENAQRQIEEFERENQHLLQTIDTLRERNEKSMDHKVKDIERENKCLHETVTGLKAEVSELQYNGRQITKSYDRLQNTVHNVELLEKDNHKLDKDNDQLRKVNSTLQLTVDKYENLEKELSDQEIQNHKLRKTVDNLKNTVSKMEILEQDNINLTVEAQHLKRALENQRNSSNKTLDLEQERDAMSKQIQMLKKSVEHLRSEKINQKDLERDLLELNTQNQKLQRNLEGATQKLEQTEQENHELELQVGKLQRATDQMRLSIRKLEDLEKDNKNLQQENTSLRREKSTIDKENRRLKQSLTNKDSTIDDVTTKLTDVERANKHLVKLTEKNQDVSGRLKDIEKENNELVQQVTIDRRTLATLREDLVNEKIHTQQLSNEVEQLTQELDKVGLNKDKLIAAEHAHDESKYAALESMMQDAFKKSMEIKVEKIQALESRLDESKSRNTHLQNDLRVAKSNLAAIQQRREEEGSHVQEREKKKFFGRSSSHKQAVPNNTTKWVLELKDHMISVERQNAALETERKSLHSQSGILQKRLNSCESQMNAMQSHLNSTQDHNTSLQAQLAKLQVENTTIQSQHASLCTHNATLQEQHSQLEHDHDKLLTNLEEMTSTHESLVSAHESLQHLHDQLSNEHEALISDQGTLKATHRTLKSELKDLQGEHLEVKHQKDTMLQLKLSIEQDRQSIKHENQSLGHLQIDYMQIREENLRLSNMNEHLNKEFTDLLHEHKRVKSDYSQLKIKHGDLDRTFTECREQLSNIDVEISRMASKCEAIDSLNSKLEEDNRKLMIQLQNLITHNQDLLIRSLENKDDFYEKQRDYQDRLTDLKRQKEKLEEKIMEQYKRYDPVKRKNRGFGANLVRKARGVLQRANRSRSQERNRSMTGDFSFTQDSPENSSLGSAESPNDAFRKNRHGSVGDLVDSSPSLSKQNRSLAKSTTAINNMRRASDMPDTNGMRGAKSTENLSLSGPRVTRYGSHYGTLGGKSSDEWYTRPNRRRTLLETTSNSGTSGRSRRVSGSSEDTTSRLSTTISLSQADSEHDMITLEEFLHESNRSPASRRKMLIENRIDPEEIKSKHSSEVAEPPPSFMTPRSPTRDSEDRYKSTRSLRAESHKQQDESGRMDSNDSGNNTMTNNPRSVSRQTSGSSLGSLGSMAELKDPRGDMSLFVSPPGNGCGSNMKTSTPKYDNNRSSQNNNSQSESPYMSLSMVRDRTCKTEEPSSRQPSSPIKTSQPMRPPSPGPAHNNEISAQNSLIYLTGRPSSVHTLPRRLPAEPPEPRPASAKDFNSLTRHSASKSHMSLLPSKYQPVASPTPQNFTNGSSSLHISPHGRSVTPCGMSSQGYASDRNTPQGHGSQGHTPLMTRQRLSSSGGASVNRNGSTSSTSSQNDAVPKSMYNNNNGDYDSPVFSPNNSNSSQHNDAIHRANLDDSQSSSTSHKGQNTSESDNQYMPGNVRNLVQNFHKSMQQSPSPNAPPPPARRTRPLSAGPYRSPTPTNNSISNSNGIGPGPLRASMGQFASRSPGSPPDNRENPHPNTATGRLLPTSPEDSSTAGATPPRPNVKPGQKKSNIWYEYGAI